MNKDIIYENILYNNNISENDLLNMVSYLPYNNKSYSDIFFQDSISECLFLENKVIKNVSLNSINGVGIRIVSGEKTIFSYSNEINYKSILDCIKKVNNVYSSNFFKKKKKLFFSPCINSFYKFNNLSLNLLSYNNKYDLLFYLDNFIRKIDCRVNYVSLKLFCNYEIILILSNDNVFIGDIKPLTCLSIKVQVEKDNLREIGLSGGGGRYSYDKLICKKYDNISVVKY